MRGWALVGNHCTRALRPPATSGKLRSARECAVRSSIPSPIWLLDGMATEGVMRAELIEGPRSWR